MLLAVARDVARVWIGLAAPRPVASERQRGLATARDGGGVVADLIVLGFKDMTAADDAITEIDSLVKGTEEEILAV